MKYLFLLIFYAPILSAAQQTGIKFEQNLTWQEIKDKAKAENKYIFADCYATWCGPCKQMDKDVYSNDSVGAHINPKFISVKIQMDTSRQDNEITKAWYSTAHNLQEEFKVIAYPTYLFFSPNAEIVHKGIGAQKTTDFIVLTENSADIHRQYYTLLKNYLNDHKDYSVMPYLAKQARAFHDMDLSNSIANDYIHVHLENDENGHYSYTKEDLNFVSSFVTQLKSNDKLFYQCFRNSSKIDSIVYMGYSKNIVNRVIKMEEITPVLIAAKINSAEPNWTSLIRTIRRKYGEYYAKRDIIQAKVEWYQSKKEWRSYVKYLVQQVEENDIENLPSSYGSVVYLNNNAFIVFQYSNNRLELRKALLWVNRALSMGSSARTNVIDTKANLLYKLGRKVDGLALEEKAALLSPNDKEIQTELKKMKRGLPTWPTE